MKALRPNLLLLSAITAVTLSAFSVSAETKNDSPLLANNTRFMLFGMQPLGEYQVRHNAVQLPQADASGAGVIGFMEVVDTGDQIIITLTDIGTAPPIPPQQVQARETSPGCVTVTWQANPETDLMGYVVYWGPQSVSQGQVPNYANSMDVGTSTSHEVCGFSPGTQYFAVKAYNTSSDFSGYSIERQVDIVGTDNTPPVITSHTPASGATNVPLDASVVFWIEDTQSGVDSNAVNVTINGSPPDRMTFSGTPAQYIVTCEVTGGFSPQATVNVAVQASDLATPANAMGASWSFTTGSAADTAPPTFCCVSPANGAVSVDPGSAVSFGVSDAGAGVDLTAIDFRINGQPVLYDMTGDEQDAVITFTNPGGFTPGSTVNVSVGACDLSAGRNCNTLNFSFGVASGGVASLVTPGSIYPNGYWVNDPARPLEVRNIPHGWVVRIFDLGGHEVRSFRNDDPAAADWSWNFTNDRGERVARALYLVRVFSNGGDLQQSGRFVVQIDR